jgi:ribosomal protein S27AE
MHGSKECFKCKTIKPLKEFYRHPQMADGHLNKCKVCGRTDAAVHRAANLARVRAYDRERAKRPERIALASRVNREWRREDKRRVAAHNAVARAIRSGKITRKDCERCGETNSVAHHESYDRKLDVTWLCQPCHKIRHREMAIAGIEP